MENKTYKQKVKEIYPSAKSLKDGEGYVIILGNSKNHVKLGWWCSKVNDAWLDAYETIVRDSSPAKIEQLQEKLRLEQSVEKQLIILKELRELLIQKHNDK